MRRQRDPGFDLPNRRTGSILGWRHPWCWVPDSSSMARATYCVIPPTVTPSWFSIRSYAAGQISLPFAFELPNRLYFMRLKTDSAPADAVTSHPQLRLQNISRSDVLEYFDNTWKL